jgi:hypothetical protein
VDAAWAAVIAGVVGAAIGAGATYLGPLRLQKRALAAEAEIRAEARRVEAVQCIAEVRSAAQAWIRYLRVVVEDASSDRGFVDLAEFDEQTAVLRGATERALAKLLAYGLDEFYGDFARELREIEDKVRWCVAERSHMAAGRLMMDTGAFSEYFTMRAMVTTRWANRINANSLRIDNGGDTEGA